MNISEETQKLTAGYKSNPELQTILKEDEWKGTPITKEDRFINLEFPKLPSYADALKVFIKANPQKEEKKKDTWKLEVVKDNSFLSENNDVIVWLGHASFFIRINGISILIDPVFFNLGILKRRSVLPLDPNEFRNINYILVSHNHRDHCDQKSLELLSKNNPQATYLTGLNLDTLLKDWTGSNNIQAAGWYQKYNTADNIEITYLPTRHWSRRWIIDTNRSLWGAFVIKANGKTLYFAGDSGKGSHFKEAGDLFPEIDVCIIGVGAYKPEWFMGPSHLSPTDAYEAARQMKSKMMIPMHYGTFELSYEPPGEPFRILEKLKQTSEGTVINILPVGKAYSI